MKAAEVLSGPARRATLRLCAVVAIGVASCASAAPLVPAGPSSVQNRSWTVTSHLNEWHRFRAASAAEGPWPAFERQYYSPNRQLLADFLAFAGISDPVAYFTRELAARRGKPEVSLDEDQRVLSLVYAATTRSIDLLSGAHELNGRIHVWRFFSLFDGMGMTLQGIPVVMLNADAFYAATDDSVRIVTAHEIHHAVRSALPGMSPGNRGILALKAGDALVAEGLAVAFSESAYPGLKLQRYFPAYVLHPEKMQAALGAEDEIRDVLLGASDRSISDPLVAPYFYGTDPADDSPPLRNSAYLVGYHVVRALLRTGRTIDELTRTDSTTVLEIYRALEYRGPSEVSGTDPGTDPGGGTDPRHDLPLLAPLHTSVTCVSDAPGPRSRTGSCLS